MRILLFTLLVLHHHHLLPSFSSSCLGRRVELLLPRKNKMRRGITSTNKTTKREKALQRSSLWSDLFFLSFCHDCCYSGCSLWCRFLFIIILIILLLPLLYFLFMLDLKNELDPWFFFSVSLKENKLPLFLCFILPCQLASIFLSVNTKEKKSLMMNEGPREVEKHWGLESETQEEQTTFPFTLDMTYRHGRRVRPKNTEKK